MGTRNLVSLLSVFCLVAVCGCISTPKHIQMYDGPPLPDDQVAHVVNATSKPGRFGSGLMHVGTSSIWLDKVDGKPTRGAILNARFRLDLLPGPHTITVHYFLHGYNVMYESFPVTLKLDAVAGHKYRVSQELTEGGHKWRPFIEDVTGEEGDKK